MRRFARLLAVTLAAGAVSLLLAVPTASAAVEAPSVAVPDGMQASYLVVDSDSGRVLDELRPHQRYRSASVVKLLIALDYLRRQGSTATIPPKDLALLQPMLRRSNDDAASVLWVRGGFTDIIHRMVALIGLTDTSAPADPGMWGYTAISASNVATIYRYLLNEAKPEYRDFIIGNLRQAKKCAADGFDQYFGIPRAAPKPWAVKQGWSGFGAHPGSGAKCVPPHTTAMLRSILASPEGILAQALTGGGDGESPGAPMTQSAKVDLRRPAMHTTGTLGPENGTIMVVLSLEPVGTSWQRSGNRITRVAHELYRTDVAAVT
jgi:hypothetical protein